MHGRKVVAVEVSFEEDGNGRNLFNGPLEKLIDGVDDGLSIGIDDQIVGDLFMSCHVDVGGFFQGDLLEEGVRVVAVVEAIDVDVIDVEQKLATASLKNAR